jgi:hypothetical protein
MLGTCCSQCGLDNWEKLLVAEKFGFPYMRCKSPYCMERKNPDYCSFCNICSSRIDDITRQKARSHKLKCFKRQKCSHVDASDDPLNASVEQHHDVHESKGVLCKHCGLDMWSNINGYPLEGLALMRCTSAQCLERQKKPDDECPSFCPLCFFCFQGVIISRQTIRSHICPKKRDDRTTDEIREDTPHDMDDHDMDDHDMDDHDINDTEGWAIDGDNNMTNSGVGTDLSSVGTDLSYVGSSGTYVTNLFFSCGSTRTAMSSLIRSAIRQNPTSGLPNMESDDQSMMLEIFSLSLHMAKSQRESLAKVFKVVQAKYSKALSALPSPPSSNFDLFLPTSLAEFGQVFSTNQHSLYKNWPSPRSSTKGLTGHAVVSLASIIGHVLAIPGSVLGIIPTKAPSISTCLAESIAAVKMQDAANERWAIVREYYETEIPPVVTIPILVWSDKAEKTKSMRNRTEVWHMTASVHPSRHNTNTQYLSAGVSKASRDEVVALLTSELSELRLPIATKSSQMRLFVTQEQKLVLVFADIIAIVRDSPEKRELLYLLQGNSRRHNITGLSSNILALKDVFRSCFHCYDRNKHFLRLLLNNASSVDDAQDVLFSDDADDVSDLSIHYRPDFEPDFGIERRCANCLNFNIYDVNHPLCRYAAPKHFPQEKANDDGTVGFHWLVVSELRTVLQECHDKGVSGEWSTETVMATMDYYCLNKVAVGIVLSHIKNALLLKEAHQAVAIAADCVAGSVVEQHFLQIIEDSHDSKHGSLYTAWVGPPEWDFCGGSLKKYVSAPMHLIFLGIIKRFLERVIAWVKSKGYFDEFSEITNGLLESVGDLHLSFLDVD